METTASFRVTAVDNSDQPIEEATVTVWPNQIWLDVGGQTVGDGASLRVAFRLMDEQRRLGRNVETYSNACKEPGILPVGSDRYRETANHEGIAAIRTLPGGSEETPTTQSIHVIHDQYEQPTEGLHRQSRVQLQRGKESEITIRMDNKGTTVIGE